MFVAWKQWVVGGKVNTKQRMYKINMCKSTIVAFNNIIKINRKSDRKWKKEICLYKWLWCVWPSAKKWLVN